MEDQLSDPEVRTTHDDWYAQAWETGFGEILFGKSPEKDNEESTIKVPIDDGTATESEAVITIADEKLNENKSSSGNITPFDLDVSDNPYIMTPPPVESPIIPPTLLPITVGHNPRKTGRYNLRPNPKPNAHPDFRMLDAVTTEETSQSQI